MASSTRLFLQVLDSVKASLLERMINDTNASLQLPSKSLTPTMCHLLLLLPFLISTQI